MIRHVVFSLGAALFTTGLIHAVAQDSRVTVEDVYIEHVSTVPANEGDTVELFARRYHGANSNGEAVIMLSSGTLPADAGLGLDGQDYNFFQHFARLGFDVFAADHTGYGFSPRPMMDDPCNVDPQVQEERLIPNPLAEPCDPTYPHPLTSYFSDWDEVESIVDHVRVLTGDDRVTLMGWSLSGPRAGGYAARQPEKVERLIMISPVYVPDAPSELPDVLPIGNPTNLGNIAGLTGFWANMVQCDGWADIEGVRSHLQTKLNEFDSLAAEWGGDPGMYYRSPTFVRVDEIRPGWNRDVAQQIRVPTLVIRGLDDTLVDNAHEFYEDLTVDQKIRVDFECGTHWAIWEQTRETVRDVLVEYLESGTVNGQNRGVMLVDRDGRIQQ